MTPKQGKKKKTEGDGNFLFFIFLQRRVIYGFILLWFHCSKEEEDNSFRHLL